MFTNVTLDPSTTASYLDISRVQFTGTTFSYDFGSLPIVHDGFIKLDITTVPSVPEPEEYMMMLLGFGMVGWQVRRKQRKTVSKR